MVLKIIISFIIGAVIGLERASPQKLTADRKKILEPHEVGVRTFSLISLLGTLGGLMMREYSSVFIIISTVFCLLVLAYYFFQTKNSKDPGITTELALIFTYLIGIMIGREIVPMQIIIMIAVIVVLVLSRKREVQDFIINVHRNELNAFIGYALIALVILPFLPNTNYSLADIPQLESFLKSTGVSLGKFADVSLFNPFKLWFIVALITGIDVIGYFLEKTVGRSKGRLVSSLAGGFISSTATTQALAQESKQTNSPAHLTGAALFANMVSFIPLFFLIGSVNPRYLTQLIPVLLIIIIACAVVGSYFYFFYKEKQKKQTAKKNSPKTENTKEIFNLSSALVFVAIYTVVRIISEVALAIFGSQGVIITTTLAALTGIDAAILTVSQMVGGELSYTLGVWTFILINAVNLLAKTFYSFLQGSRGFAVRFGVGVAIIIGSSVLWPLLFSR